MKKNNKVLHTVANILVDIIVVIIICLAFALFDTLVAELPDNIATILSFLIFIFMVWRSF